jgi:hypothetical protein
MKWGPTIRGYPCSGTSHSRIHYFLRHFRPDRCVIRSTILKYHYRSIILCGNYLNAIFYCNLVIMVFGAIFGTFLLDKTGRRQVAIILVAYAILTTITVDIN